MATIVAVTSGTVRLVRSGFFRFLMASPSSAISTIVGIHLGGWESQLMVGDVVLVGKYGASPTKVYIPTIASDPGLLVSADTTVDVLASSMGLFVFLFPFLFPSFFYIFSLFSCVTSDFEGRPSDSGRAEVGFCLAGRAGGVFEVEIMGERQS